MSPSHGVAGTVQMMLAIDDHADRLSLQEFLTGITDVEVHEIPSTPAPGAAGPLWDVLSVACGAGGGVTAVCYAIKEWIKSRVATVKLTVGDRTMEITAVNADALVAQVAEVLKAIAADGD
jgi:membrane-associated two-gene conflict system component 1 (EACC1)